MKLTLKRRSAGQYTFYETTLFNTRVSLSKKLVEVLEGRGALHSDCTIPDDLPEYLRLTAQSTTNGGKTYTNIYLTLSKDCPAVVATGDKAKERVEDF